MIDEDSRISEYSTIAILFCYSSMTSFSYNKISRVFTGQEWICPIQNAHWYQP